MFNGVLDQLLELPLDFLETSDVIPGDGWDFHHGLPDGGGCALAHGITEVLHGDGEAVKNLGIDVLILQINQVHLLMDLLKGGLGAEGS